MATHKHSAFQQMKRPLAVNSMDTRVTLDGQRETIDDDEDVIIQIIEKEDNSISSSEGGKDELADMSSAERF